MVPRTLLQKIETILRKTSKSIVVIGPRQTGKSTMLKVMNPRLTINLSDEATYLKHLKDPGLLPSMVRSLPGKSVVFIDEIQRIPSLLNSVQAMIDENKSHQFLITGSSARKLKAGQANLLPGRTFWYHLHPLTYRELESQWNLEKALTVGCLPEIYLEDFGPDLLTNYINTYLREEIKAEALVRQVDSYARFIDAAAECSGKILNYTQLSSDAEIPKETLRRFYDILVDTLIVRRIGGFNEIKGSRKAVQKEKFIFFDMGVRNSVLNQHRNKFTATQFGELFEQWMILQAIAFSDYEQKGWRFYFYRDDLKQEVDLVVETGTKLLAIEIKFAKKFKPEFTKHLKAFASYAKSPVEPYIVYCGDELQMRDGIPVVPYTKFLTETILSF